MGKDKGIPGRSADIIIGDLGEGTSFYIKYFGIKWRLRIRELTTERLIKISAELEKIADIKDNDEATKFMFIMEHAKDARHIAKAIAIATGSRFQRIVTRAILRLKPADQQTLLNLVMRYSDPDAFFFTITSARRTSILRTIRNQAQ